MATASCRHATLLPHPSAHSTNLLTIASCFFLRSSFCFLKLSAPQDYPTSRRKGLSRSPSAFILAKFRSFQTNNPTFLSVFPHCVRHCFSQSMGAGVGVCPLRRSGRTARLVENCGVGKDGTEEHDKQRPEVGLQPKTCSRF